MPRQWDRGAVEPADAVQFGPGLRRCFPGRMRMSRPADGERKHGLAVTQQRARASAAGPCGCHSGERELAAFVPAKLRR